MKTKKLTKKQITKLMERFDFEKVHNHMVATDWKWSSCEGVPTMDQIKETALQLLHYFEIGTLRLGTGGLSVRTDACKGASLSFDVSHSDHYDEVA